MSRITINGKCYIIEGSLSQINGKWYDGMGKEIDLENLEGVKEAKTINITIEGNVDRLDVEHCNTITINGDCNRVKSTSGNIQCHNIEGDAETISGDIECGIIHGNAKTVSGDIHSGEVNGKKDTVSGKVNGQKPSVSSGVQVNHESGSMFGSRTTVFSGENTDTISGRFSVTRSADGKKHMFLSRNCAFNGRLIRDMSETELNAWITAQAAKGKIITIID